MVLGEDLVPPD